ncbi:hypothetical protein AAFF_G00188010 [Aldrovandia affinis]|uniref:Nuclear mitotic apparatus protein 1 n=1 Tax=Aldrovandia affinis TaxID=143900 RepID=A0AAD7SXY2_9TELE|nr:hypothetical protein AAFF_G00188010 [Aldrovandia affinis]
MRLQAAETEEAERKELEQKAAQLQTQVLQASTLASEREAKLNSLQTKVQESDNMRLQAAETEEAQRKELEQKVAQQITSLRHRNEDLLSTREELQKERDDLESQLQIMREELSTLHPLREVMAERSLLNHDLQKQLSVKSEALEHYKLQMEKAKNHYNGKKQQLLEANEKVQAITKALETSKQEAKTLKEQMKVLLLELEQANGLQKDLTSKVNSLQAQLDYMNRDLQEQSKLGKCYEEKAKETVYQKVTENRPDTSEDSLDLSLDDSLNSNRRPSKRKESSTPVVRSSERLQARRRNQGKESLETLFFTPMNDHNVADRKLESSITSLGDLVLDSTKKSHSARRRTTQVINITMTKKTPGRVEADSEDGSFYSLQTAQSYPDLTTQRGRPFSLELSEQATVGDQLQHLPGYRRSTASSAAPTRSISTFRVGAENEPEYSQDGWMRIAELQARNQACLPHLKSSYPIESRPSLGKLSFAVTDDDLRMGDPNETIRRASMMPSQIQDSLASHRLSMLPGQIRDGPPSHRHAHKAQNDRAATLPLKRNTSDPNGPDTPEAKKLSSCFSHPMTPKDRRFTSQNSQNRSPNAPAERRQSMMFSVVNTPKKNVKNSLLQKGINKMRASTRKSPGSTSKIPRSAKSPNVEKSQRRSPRISSNKSPNFALSTRKNVSAQFMECVFVQREETALEMEHQPI